MCLCVLDGAGGLDWAAGGPVDESRRFGERCMGIYFKNLYLILNYGF